MKQPQFDEYIKKLSSGASMELKPHDCAYFISLFARYEENISFFVEIKDGMATLTSDVQVDFFKDAIALADKRERLCKNVKLCPDCHTEQVQLVNWIDKVEWKCRRCKHRWTSDLPSQISLFFEKRAVERTKYYKMSIDELLGSDKEEDE